jgi:hypothetical protein
MKQGSGTQGVDLVFAETEYVSEAYRIYLRSSNVSDTHLVTCVDRGCKSLDRREMNSAGLGYLLRFLFEAPDVNLV